MLGSLRSYFLKRKYGPSIIVVSGLPRSGTSMMMKMLSAGGLELATDNIRTADEDNPKGYFELEQVKELDKGGDKSWLGEYRGKVVKIISFLLRDLPDDFHYKVIFMRRDFEEIIASQNKMLVRRGEPTDEAKNEKMMQHYRFHLRKVEAMLEFGDNFSTIDIKYRDVLDHPEEQAARIAGFIGMKLEPNRMAEAVDRQLYRNRRQAG